MCLLVSYLLKKKTAGYLLHFGYHQNTLDRATPGTFYQEQLFLHSKMKRFNLNCFSKTKIHTCKLKPILRTYIQIKFFFQIWMSKNLHSPDMVEHGYSPACGNWGKRILNSNPYRLPREILSLKAMLTIHSLLDIRYYKTNYHRKIELYYNP